MASRVSRGIALSSLDRGIRRGWVVNITPRPHFTPGKDPVPIEQEAGSGPVWTGGKISHHRDILGKELMWLEMDGTHSWMRPVAGLVVVTLVSPVYAITVLVWLEFVAMQLEEVFSLWWYQRVWRLKICWFGIFAVDLCLVFLTRHVGNLYPPWKCGWLIAQYSEPDRC
jgi:hypothetical protein